MASAEPPPPPPFISSSACACISFSLFASRRRFRRETADGLDREGNLTWRHTPPRKREGRRARFTVCRPLFAFLHCAGRFYLANLRRPPAAAERLFLSRWTTFRFLGPRIFARRARAKKAAAEGRVAERALLVWASVGASRRRIGRVEELAVFECRRARGGVAAAVVGGGLDDAEYRRQLDIQRERLLNAPQRSRATAAFLVGGVRRPLAQEGAEGGEEGEARRRGRRRRRRSTRRRSGKKRGSSDDDDSDDAEAEEGAQEGAQRERDDGSDSDSSDSERERRRREKKRKRKEREGGGDDATAAPVQVVYAGSSVNPYG